MLEYNNNMKTEIQSFITIHKSITFKSQSCFFGKKIFFQQKDATAKSRFFGKSYLESIFWRMNLCRVKKLYRYQAR